MYNDTSSKAFLGLPQLDGEGLRDMQQQAQRMADVATDNAIMHMGRRWFRRNTRPLKQKPLDRWVVQFGFAPLNCTCRGRIYRDRHRGAKAQRERKREIQRQREHEQLENWKLKNENWKIENWKNEKLKIEKWKIEKLTSEKIENW